mmetsp:Transcript_25354/g.35544  ORF Transcript_25354/g.35544 Transcript_25354/m.35544 type:complete len:83 (+) Transcript_25354:66-314(+)
MDDKIHITVRGLPKLLTFSITKNTTIQQIRVLVSQSHPCELSSLSISMANTLLTDQHTTAQEYGITDGVTLYAHSNFKSGAI